MEDRVYTHLGLVKLPLCVPIQLFWAPLALHSVLQTVETVKGERVKTLAVNIAACVLCARQNCRHFPLQYSEKGSLRSKWKDLSVTYIQCVKFIPRNTSSQKVSLSKYLNWGMLLLFCPFFCRETKVWALGLFPLIFFLTHCILLLWKICLICALLNTISS